jgi:hypothetical protein
MALKDLLSSSLPNYCVNLLSGKNICFRPMIVSEEKSLLLAKQNEDKQSIVKNLINVLSNCCSDESLKNIKNISITDFENLFLSVRGKSIGEIETFTVKCPETQEQVQIKINLEKDVQLSPNTANNIIKLNDNLVLIMKEPSVYSLFKYPNYDKNNEQLFGFISSCMKELQTNKESINCEEMPEQEVIDFIKNLTKKQFNDITTYLSNISKIYILANYKTKDDKERQLKISGIFNYFNFFFDHLNLKLYYRQNFLLKNYHNYTLYEIENMIPWERSVYIEQLRVYLKEKEQKNKGFELL